MIPDLKKIGLIPPYIFFNVRDPKEISGQPDNLYIGVQIGWAKVLLS